MQDQRSRDEDAGSRFTPEQSDSIVLDLLLRGGPWPWSVKEIARELGDEPDALDAVRRLASGGLVHLLGEFVFPTRAARRASELQLEAL